jgi:hypothetical protein
MISGILIEINYENTILNFWFLESIHCQSSIETINLTYSFSLFNIDYKKWKSNSQFPVGLRLIDRR